MLDFVHLSNKSFSTYLLFFSSMLLIIQVLTSLLVLELVQSLKVLPKRDAMKNDNSVKAFIKSLMNTKINQKTNYDKSDPIQLVKARKLFDTSNSNIGRSKKKPPIISAKQNHAEIVERELQDVISRQYSSLKDKPYVETRGQNDYLVLGQDVHDDFVTVVPNDIYYPIEKKCVNWLDDCSLQGIRARLLEKVRSPYK